MIAIAIVIVSGNDQEKKVEAIPRVQVVLVVEMLDMHQDGMRVEAEIGTMEIGINGCGAVINTMVIMTVTVTVIDTMMIMTVTVIVIVI